MLGADTVVVLDEHILEKPKDAGDAFRMIRLLSGREHSVITGVCLRRGDEFLSDAQETRVRFISLTNQEIEGYVASGEPMDKAGAYAIQGLASEVHRPHRRRLFQCRRITGLSGLRYVEAFRRLLEANVRVALPHPVDKPVRHSHCRKPALTDQCPIVEQLALFYVRQTGRWRKVRHITQFDHHRFGGFRIRVRHLQNFGQSNDGGLTSAVINEYPIVGTHLADCPDRLRIFDTVPNSLFLLPNWSIEYVDGSVFARKYVIMESRLASIISTIPEIRVEGERDSPGYGGAAVQ